jgi:hypothetical protein
MTEFALRMMQSARPVGVGVPIGESASATESAVDGDTDADDDIDDGIDVYSDGVDASNAASAESALQEIRRSHGGSTNSTSSSSSAGSDAPAAHTYSELESLHVLLAHANAWIDPTEEAAATPVVGAAPGTLVVMRANHTAGVIL